MGKPKMKSKKRGAKINLVFNEDKRKEFLTGFHKRKQQRKKDAQAKLEKQLQEEKKRFKLQARESYKKLVKSYTPVPEVEHLLSEEYDDQDVNVKVVEWSTSDIAKQNNWIGANQPLSTSQAQSEASEKCDSDTDVPGMNKSKRPNTVTAKTKAQIKNIVKKEATKNVQKSRPFQIKNKLERQKQKRKSDYKKRMRIKFQNKKNKRPGFVG